MYEIMSNTQVVPWWSRGGRSPDGEDEAQAKAQAEAERRAERRRSKDIVERATARVEGIRNFSWMLKSNVDHMKNRYAVKKIAAFLVTSVLAVCGTYYHIEPILQIVSYLLWLAVFFLADPLTMWGRFLALPTRVCMAVSLGTVILMCWRPGVDSACLCVVTVFVTVMVTKFLNVSWLIADNWTLSENAQKSMTYDTEDVSGKSWQASGRREARAMLYEIGLDGAEDVLDVYGLPLYKLGYCSGLKKQGQIEANKVKLEQLKVQHQYDSEQIASLEKQIAAYEEDFNEKEEENRGLLFNISTYQKQIKELEHRAALLEATNEELLNLEEEPDNIVLFSKEEPEESKEQEPERTQTGALTDEDIAKIQELKEAGHSYNEIAKAVGCSKSTAGKYCRMA